MDHYWYRQMNILGFVVSNSPPNSRYGTAQRHVKPNLLIFFCHLEKGIICGCRMEGFPISNILIIDFFGSKIYFSKKFAAGVFWWRLCLKFMKKLRQELINSTVSDCSWHKPRTKNSIKINKSQNPQIVKFYAKKNEEYLINFLGSENRKLHCRWVKITFHSRKKLCQPLFNNNFSIDVI